MLRFTGKTAGEFQEKTAGKYFTYTETQDAWALSNGFTHEIDVLEGVRYARVLKTVAHVCVDEDSNGPVLESWSLTKHYQHRNGNPVQYA